MYMFIGTSLSGPSIPRKPHVLLTPLQIILLYNFTSIPNTGYLFAPNVSMIRASSHTHFGADLGF